MAAYAATLTLAQRNAKAVYPGVGMVYGTINVTNYNSTLVEVALDTYFTSDPTVILGGATDAGYLVAWDTTSKSVKAWDHLDTGVGEVANDTDIGAVSFIAIGTV
jgi:hypothetical protein